jgi:hypothetical protein
VAQPTPLTLFADELRRARTARWRSSSRSNTQGGECVEVADNLPGVVAVRDSKDRRGPVLTFTPAMWRAFVAGATRRDGESSSHSS